MNSQQLHTDLTALIVVLDRHARVMRTGRQEHADDTSISLAYRRVGNALERLIARAKLEQDLNKRD